MIFTKMTGFDGLSHDSKAEAATSFLLAEHEIFQDTSYLPFTFSDSNGETFRAKSDFNHAPTGVRFEFKTKLNSVRTCATSKSQLENSRSCNDHWKALRFGWNHSAKKLKITQEISAKAGMALIPIFPAEPDLTTQALLSKEGIFWLWLGSRGWFHLTNFLKLAKHRIPVTLTYHDEQGSSLCSISCTVR